MTKSEAKQMVKNHNDAVDNYVNNELAVKLNAKNGKIKMSQWFEAQTLIRQQNFYEKGHKILVELRSQGFDVKMNMQSDKLVF
jgi:hypothetical protein